MTHTCGVTQAFCSEAYISTSGKLSVAMSTVVHALNFASVANYNEFDKCPVDMPIARVYTILQLQILLKTYQI